MTNQTPEPIRIYGPDGVTYITVNLDAHCGALHYKSAGSDGAWYDWDDPATASLFYWAIYAVGQCTRPLRDHVDDPTIPHIAESSEEFPAKPNEAYTYRLLRERLLLMGALS